MDNRGSNSFERIVNRQQQELQGELKNITNNVQQKLTAKVEFETKDAENQFRQLTDKISESARQIDNALSNINGVQQLRNNISQLKSEFDGFVGLLSNLQSQFKIDGIADDIGKINNQFQQLSIIAKDNTANLNQLVGTLNQINEASTNFGQRIDQFSGSTESLKRNVTDFNSVVDSLKNNTREASDIFDRLNIKGAFDPSSVEGISQISSKLEALTNQLSNFVRTKEEIKGAFTEINGALANGETDQAERNYKQLESTLLNFTNVLKNVGGELTSLDSAVKSAGLGDAFSDIVKGINGEALSALNNFAEIVKSLPSGMDNLGGSIKSTVESLTDLASKIRELGGLSDTLDQILSKDVSGNKTETFVKSLADSVVDLSKVVKENGSDILNLMNNLGDMKPNNEGIQKISESLENMDVLMKNLADNQEKVSQAFSGGNLDSAEAIKNLVANESEILKANRDIVKEIESTLGSLNNTEVVNVIENMHARIKDVGEGIKSVMQDVKSFMEGDLGDVQALKGLDSFDTSKIETFKKNITEAFSGIDIKDSLDGLHGDLESFFGSIDNLFKSNQLSQFENLSETLKKSLGSLEGDFDAFKSHIGEIGSLMGSVSDNKVELLDAQSISLVNNQLKSLVDSLGELSTNKDILKDAFNSDAVKGLDSDLRSVQNTVSSVIDSFGRLKDVTKDVNLNHADNSLVHISGSHRNGLKNVPFDGYIAELHEGERVLTKDENHRLSDSHGHHRRKIQPGERQILEFMGARGQHRGYREDDLTPNEQKLLKMVDPQSKYGQLRVEGFYETGGDIDHEQVSVVHPGEKILPANEVKSSKNLDQFYASADKFGEEFVKSLNDSLKPIYDKLNQSSSTVFKELDKNENNPEARAMAAYINEMQATLAGLKDLGSGKGGLNSAIQNVLKSKNVEDAENAFGKLTDEVKNVLTSFEKLSKNGNGYLNANSRGMSNGNMPNTFENKMLNNGLVGDIASVMRQFQRTVDKMPAQMKDTVSNSGQFNDFVKQLNDIMLTNFTSSSVSDMASQMKDNIGGKSQDFNLSVLTQSLDEFGKTIEKSSKSILEAMVSTRSVERNMFSRQGGPNSDPSMEKIPDKLSVLKDVNQEMVNFYKDAEKSLGDVKSIFGNKDMSSDEKKEYMKDVLPKLLQDSKNVVSSSHANTQVTTDILDDIKRAADKTDSGTANQMLDIVSKLQDNVSGSGEAMKKVLYDVVSFLKDADLEGEASVFEKALEDLTESIKEANSKIADTINTTVGKDIKPDDTLHKMVNDSNIQRAYKEQGSSYRRQADGAYNLEKKMSTVNRDSDAVNAWNRASGDSTPDSKEVEKLAREMQLILKQMSEGRKIIDKEQSKGKEGNTVLINDTANTMIDKQKQLNSKANILGGIVDMDTDELKDAPESVKQVIKQIKTMLNTSLQSNADTMFLAKLLGIDEGVEDLEKFNKELDNTNQKLQNTTNTASRSGGGFKNFASNSWNFLTTGAGMLKKGLQSGANAFQLGSVANSIMNPFALMGDATKIYQEQGRYLAGANLGEQMQYGGIASNYNTGGTNLERMLNGTGLRMQQQTNGLIQSEDLLNTYGGLVKNVGGLMTGANGGAQTNDTKASEEMGDLARVSTVYQKAYGVSDATMTDSIKQWRELRMESGEMEYQFGKIAASAAALNIPFEQHLKQVTAMATQYRTLGLSADQASNIIGGLMFSYNMSQDEANQMGQHVGNAVGNMNQAELGFFGMQSGNYSDPFGAMYQLQYNMWDKDGKVDPKKAAEKADLYMDKIDFYSQFGGDSDMGKWIVAQQLEKDGFSKKEAGMAIEGGRDKLRELFEGKLTDTALKDGVAAAGEKMPSKDNPEDKTNEILGKIANASEHLSGIDKTLNAYNVVLKDIVGAHRVLLDEVSDFSKQIYGLEGYFDKVIVGFAKAAGALNDMTKDMGDQLSTLAETIAAIAIGAAALGAISKLAKAAGAGKKKDKDKNKKKKKKKGSGDNESERERSSGDNERESTSENERERRTSESENRRSRFNPDELRGVHEGKVKAAGLMGLLAMAGITADQMTGGHVTKGVEHGLSAAGHGIANAGKWIWANTFGPADHAHAAGLDGQVQNLPYNSKQGADINQLPLDSSTKSYINQLAQTHTTALDEHGNMTKWGKEQFDSLTGAGMSDKEAKDALKDIDKSINRLGKQAENGEADLGGGSGVTGKLLNGQSATSNSTSLLQDMNDTLKNILSVLVGGPIKDLARNIGDEINKHGGVVDNVVTAGGIAAGAYGVKKVSDAVKKKKESKKSKSKSKSSSDSHEKTTNPTEEHERTKSKTHTEAHEESKPKPKPKPDYYIDKHGHAVPADEWDEEKNKPKPKPKPKTDYYIDPDGHTVPAEEYEKQRQKEVEAREKVKEIAEGEGKPKVKASGLKAIGSKVLQHSPAAISAAYDTYLYAEDRKDMSRMHQLAGIKGKTAIKDHTKGTIDFGTKLATSMGGAWAGTEAGALLGAGIGSIVPGLGTAVGGAIGGGLGFVGGLAGGMLGWNMGDKITHTKAYDKALGTVGLSSKQLEKEKEKDSTLYRNAMGIQKDLKKNAGVDIDELTAVMAAKVQKDNASHLKGASTADKNDWSVIYAQAKLDGKSDNDAKKMADEQVKTVGHLKDIHDTNKSQLEKIAELYGMSSDHKKSTDKSNDKMDAAHKTAEETQKDIGTGNKTSAEHKKVLDEYSKKYDLTTKDAKKVLDATSDATGISKDKLSDMAKSMDLSLTEFAAMILSEGGPGSKKAADDINKDKKVDEVMNGKGLLDKVSKYQDGLNWFEKTGVDITTSDAQVKDAISTVAKQSGLSEKDVKKALQDAGIDEDVFARWLLDNADSKTKGEVGKLGKGEVGKFLGNAKDAKKIDGSHAGGLYSVPFDGYTAELHEGERVLTRNDASIYNKAEEKSADLSSTLTEGSGPKETLNGIAGSTNNRNKATEKLEDLKDQLEDANDKYEKQIGQLHDSFKQDSDANKARDKYYSAVDKQNDTQNKYNDGVAKSNDTFEKQNTEANKLHTEANKLVTHSNDLIEALTTVAKNQITKLDEVSASIITAINDASAQILQQLSLLSTSSPTDSSADQGTGGGYLDQVAKLITNGEGNYASVARNDNGALSIGKFQWHGNRARDLLKDIKSQDPSSWNKYAAGLGLNLNSDWSHLTLTQEQAMGLSNLLDTDKAKEIQDALMRKDVQGYIDKGKEAGITDPQALAYFADLYNQSPAQALKIAKAAGKGASLDQLYKASMNNSVMSKYASRRKTAYNAAKKVTTDSASQGTGGGNAADYYLNNFNVTTPFSPGKALPDGWHPNGHNGIDLNKKGTTGNGDMGTPIESIVGGTVEKVLSAAQSGGYGNRVVIRGSDGNEYFYSHLQEKPDLKVGEKVKEGQVIGKMGSTGRSSAAHLDLEVRNSAGKLINPLTLLQQLAAGSGGDQGTGGGYDIGTSVLKRGSKGDNVTALQAALKDLGFDPKGVDGIFGKNTEAAVKAFEKANGLTQDGILDKQTLDKLNEALDKNTDATDKNTSSTSSSGSGSGSSSTPGTSSNIMPNIVDIGSRTAFTGWSVDLKGGQMGYNSVNTMNTLYQNAYNSVTPTGKDSSKFYSIQQNDAGVSMYDLQKNARNSIDSAAAKSGLNKLDINVSVDVKNNDAQKKALEAKLQAEIQKFYDELAHETNNAFGTTKTNSYD
jgi:murein DD-endopeptidase MepM/ murein hydrolase activator NlpD/peptidoglycan hydrolase-like protein with peptidoglycan-binding domain/methyl-accepting chemotaxis protein